MYVNEKYKINNLYILFIKNIHIIFNKYNMIPFNKIKSKSPNNIGSLELLYMKNNNLFPISFSIPEIKIVNEVPLKTKMISDLIPGDRNTYIYNTEDDYYNEYRKSMFALTFKKGGWDCMRHYEILACGCIPYFPDINLCPYYILYFLPKELIKYGNELFHLYKDKNIMDLKENDKILLEEHIKKLIGFTKIYLTTTNMCNYVINTLKNRCYITDVKKILFISADPWTEYLRCSLLHGFKLKFGKDCHDYPKIRHLYKNEDIDYVNYCYGRGYSLSNLLEQDYRNNNLDNTIEEDIINKKYDIIIWGDFYRWVLPPQCYSIPYLEYYDLASKYYESNRLIFFNGWDRQHDIYIYNFFMNFVNKGNIVFVREFPNLN